MNNDGGDGDHNDADDMMGSDDGSDDALVRFVKGLAPGQILLRPRRFCRAPFPYVPPDPLSSPIRRGDLASKPPQAVDQSRPACSIASVTRYANGPRILWCSQIANLLLAAEIGRKSASMALGRGRESLLPIRPSRRIIGPISNSGLASQLSIHSVH